MKKQLFILVLFVASVISIEAQTNVYHHFPDSNAVWGLTTGCYDVGYFCHDVSYVKDFYVGDTIIGSAAYKIIEETIFSTTSGLCCGVVGGSGYGFLREDTVARKVYWRNEYMSSDSLLYNFTLNVGDTIKGFLNPTNNEIIIESIDSVLVGTTYRKRFNIATPIYFYHNLSIIEGIGSTRGLTQLYWGDLFKESTLNCFSVNGSIVYSDSTNPDSTPCGSLTVSLSNLDRNNFLEVFPNPALDFIALAIQSEFLPVDVSIFTIKGEKILALQLQSTECEIDIADLPPGIYVVEARGEKVLRGKFVKE